MTVDSRVARVLAECAVRARFAALEPDERLDLADVITLLTPTAWFADVDSDEREPAAVDVMVHLVKVGVATWDGGRWGQGRSSSRPVAPAGGYREADDVACPSSSWRACGGRAAALSMPVGARRAHSSRVRSVFATDFDSSGLTIRVSCPVVRVM